MWRTGFDPAGKHQQRKRKYIYVCARVMQKGKGQESVPMSSTLDGIIYCMASLIKPILLFSHEITQTLDTPNAQQIKFPEIKHYEIDPFCKEHRLFSGSITSNEIDTQPAREGSMVLQGRLYCLRRNPQTEMEQVSTFGGKNVPPKWLCVQFARIDTKKRASSYTFLFSLTGLRELVRLLCCLSSRFLTHAICTMSINKQGQLLGSQEPPVYSFQVFVQLPLLRTLNVLVACNCFGFIFQRSDAGCTLLFFLSRWNYSFAKFF